MPERMTAKKVRIIDLASGEWVQQDGMEPSYVISKAREKVSRARVLATVVSKFMSGDGNFGSVTLDDGTDTIRAKCFKDLTLLQKAEEGQLVDLIGKVREYNGEIYLMPEVIAKVRDPNMLLLRKLELMRRARELEKSGGEEEARQSKPGSSSAKPAMASERDMLRKKMLEIIESGKSGIGYASLVEKSGQPEDKVDAVVNELLAEGICYEPTPGKIRKI